MSKTRLPFELYPVYMELSRKSWYQDQKEKSLAGKNFQLFCQNGRIFLSVHLHTEFIKNEEANELLPWESLGLTSNSIYEKVFFLLNLFTFSLSSFIPLCSFSPRVSLVFTPKDKSLVDKTFCPGSVGSGKQYSPSHITQLSPMTPGKFPRCLVRNWPQGVSNSQIYPKMIIYESSRLSSPREM